MYKDKSKQKEANRQANKRYREKVSREQGITDEGITPVKVALDCVLANRDHSVATCQARARQGLPWRNSDPIWPYTRHLTPAAYVAWFRTNKPTFPKD